MNGHATGRERERYAAGADAQFEGGTVAGQPGPGVLADSPAIGGRLHHPAHDQ